ncbi:MAG: caffeoyl-CoA O-methyltransferase [Thermodesulfobacteriota bacterium]|nr:caffeoyl-CoA O-methyltransferase [Thermodesulfobacteriota bacterium]
MHTQNKDLDKRPEYRGQGAGDSEIMGAQYRGQFSLMGVAEMLKALIANLTVVALLSGFPPWLYSQVHPLNDLDKRVRAFLSKHASQWDYMSVPEADGKLLYDIIVKNKYTSALEIGTSTGHSAIWIAWAVSKTGGKLITVEIDESRYRTAVENFKKAGLSGYIDARLGDAHELVPKLDGPFDFVFADADKNWHKNYFDAVEPKLVTGGCYTTHNVSYSGDVGFGQGSYVEYLKGLKNFETTFNHSGAGVAISYKRSGK